MIGFKPLVGLICITAISPACAPKRPPPSIPRAVTPAAPARHRLLEVPPWLEIVSVDFAAAMSGTDNRGSASRGFYTVFGRHREFGTHFLLLYEGVPWRTAPIEIIEVVPTLVPDTPGGASEQ